MVVNLKDGTAVESSADPRSLPVQSSAARCAAQDGQASAAVEPAPPSCAPEGQVTTPDDTANIKDAEGQKGESGASIIQDDEDGEQAALEAALLNAGGPAGWAPVSETSDAPAAAAARGKGSGAKTRKRSTSAKGTHGAEEGAVVIGERVAATVRRRGKSKSSKATSAGGETNTAAAQDSSKAAEIVDGADTGEPKEDLTTEMGVTDEKDGPES
jgi:hypothetical protein